MALILLFTLGVARGQDQGTTPVPDEAAQKEAETLIREIFEKEYKNTAPAAQRDLAKKLLLQTDKNRNSPDVRYVLFREARDLFLEGNDVVRALEVQDRLEKEYALDGLKVRMDLLLKAAARAEAGSDARTVAEAMVELVKALLAKDEFDAAEELSKHAATVARRAKHIPLAKATRDLAARVAEEKRNLKVVLEARRTLETAPEDARANLVLGRYLVVQKGEWNRGLTHLAKGSDEELKKLALKDLSNPTEAKAQVTLGDDWWELGEKSSADSEKDAFRSRGSTWYTMAVPGLKGLHLLRIKKRLEKVPPPKTQGAIPVRGASPDLHGHWTFDEGSGTQANDRSGNDTPLTLSPGVSWTEGRRGGAIRLDGVGGHALTARGPKPDFGLESFTLSCFVKREGEGALRLVNKWDDFRNWKVGQGWLIDVNKSRVRIRISDRKGNADYTFQAGITLNRWHHLAVVVDRAKESLAMYVDGTPVGDTRSLASLTGSLRAESPLAIGKIASAPGGAGRYFRGCLDELRIYRRALAPSELKQLAE